MHSDLEPDASPHRHPPGQARDEIILRVGLVALLILLAFQVVQPFVMPLLWAVIVAVSMYPLHRSIEEKLGGRRSAAAILSTFIALGALIVPVIYLGDTLVVTATHVGARMNEDSFHIPSPPTWVSRVPLVGHKAQEYWSEAARDKSATRAALLRHLKPVAAWLASAAAGLTLAIAQFIAAVLIAGFLMARAREIISWSRRVVVRLVPERGAALVGLGGATIRNVSRGVLGVALIQSLCAGIAFILVGIPAAGVWALLCFICASIQIGVLPVVGPIALYALFKMDLIVSIPFALWCTFVGLIDNILRPLIFHHGMNTPLWVFVVGSIGGLLSLGFIGLFIGPVVLVLGYELGSEWLDRDPGEAERA